MQMGRVVPGKRYGNFLGGTLDLRSTLTPSVLWCARGALTVGKMFMSEGAAGKSRSGLQGRLVLEVD